MSKMLTCSFGTTALAAARKLAQSGLRPLAFQRIKLALGAVAGTPAAAEVHRLASELYREAGRFATARRHLRAALKLRPGDAELFHELGWAYADDPYGCDRRAARAFRRAVRLSATHPQYRAALGLALIRLNRVKPGLRHLEHAITLAPTDETTLSLALTATREAERPDLGLKWLSAAVFLAPSNPRLASLRDRAKFDVARLQQAAQSRTHRRSTVPFLRLAVAGGITRSDSGSRPMPHFQRLRAYRAKPSGW
jgi:Flp pilus assembly protein TadD